MNTSRAAFIPAPDFEALKAITRLQWTLNFEAWSGAQVPSSRAAA